MARILDDGTDIVLFSKLKACYNIARAGDVDRIRHIVPELTGLRVGREWVAAMILKPWHHERGRRRLASGLC